MIVKGIKDCFETPYNLINISDFNSLIAQSQVNNTPVFLLTKEQVQKTGTVWENMKKTEIHLMKRLPSWLNVLSI